MYGEVNIRRREAGARFEYLFYLNISHWWAMFSKENRFFPNRITRLVSKLSIILTSNLIHGTNNLSYILHNLIIHWKEVFQNATKKKHHVTNKIN